jgi:alpha-glucosidase
MTGRHKAQDLNREVARQMRQAMHDSSPQSLLIGEHCHDFTLDARGDGWDGVMNYAGFTRIRHSFNLVGSHDTTRIRTLVGEDSRQVDVAAGLLFTMPGIPMMTYGDEIGMRGDYGEDGRRPMPWNAGSDDDRWDARILEVYRGLISARNLCHALRHGGLRWVHADDDVLVFLRESTEQTALVHCARAAHVPIQLSARHLTGVAQAHTVYGRDLTFSGDGVSLMADRPEVSIWTWPRP